MSLTARREDTELMLLGTQRINAQGRLEIGGCDTVELAKQFGSDSSGRFVNGVLGSLVAKEEIPSKR